MLKNRTFLPILIFSLAASFYLYEFALQVSPAVMTQELMRDFGVDAAGLGAVVAFYFYSYTAMQIPAGMLYDKFGPRILITLALLVCGIGSIYFGLTESLAMVSFGRLLMGVGSAFSFIGVLTLVNRWFPPKRFALLAGIAQLLASVGALFGQIPLAHWVTLYGWRHTMTAIGGGGILLAILVWLIVRDAPGGYTPKKVKKKYTQRRLLLKVCQNPQTWWVGCYTFSAWAPMAVFAALWGIPYLKTLYGINALEAGFICSWAWVGVGLGSPMVGWWSDHIQCRRLPLIVCSLCGIISMLIILFMPDLPKWLMSCQLFILGLSAAGQTTTFGLIKDISRPDSVSTATGFNNMATVLGGAIFQPVVGVLLRLNWDGVTREGVPLYNAHDYRLSLIVLPILSIMGLIMATALIRETHCQHQYEVHHD